MLDNKKGLLSYQGKTLLPAEYVNLYDMDADEYVIAEQTDHTYKIFRVDDEAENEDGVMEVLTADEIIENQIDGNTCVIKDGNTWKVCWLDEGQVISEFQWTEPCRCSSYEEIRAES